MVSAINFQPETASWALEKNTEEHETSEYM